MSLDGSPGTSVGGRLAGRLTDQVVRGKAAITERLAPHWVRVGMGVQEEFFRLTGAEVRRTVGPLWAKVADHPDAPDWLRSTTEFVARGHGQWQTLLAGTATGAAMGGGLLDLIRNEMAPVVGRLIAGNPNLWLSPTELAAASTRGLTGSVDEIDLAARSGIDFQQFRILQGLNTTRIAPSEVVELFRRGRMTARQAVDALVLAGFDANTAPDLLALARLHIPLADAGQMWGRGIIDTKELRHLASIQGFTDEDADRYAEASGQPPPPEDLYAAFRRGVINRDRLQRGIQQGPIRVEWFDVLEALTYHSMTPDSAASAVTQGHMTIEEGEAIATEYGLRPGQFTTIVETAGRPPGLEFAAEAYLRGFIDDGEWERMFLESSIKNRYIPVMRKMRTRLMPRETATSLLAKGVITADRCAEILRQLGYDAQDVEAFIAAATTERGAAQRDLSLATTRSLYLEEEITAAQATEMLQALGYDDFEIGLELSLAEIARLRTYRNAVITRIRNGYVKGLITAEVAGTTMDALAVPPGRRDGLLSIWDIERTTVTRDLTPAQIVAAAKKGIIEPAAAANRLIGQGYDEEAAFILLAISGVGPGAPTP